MKMKNDCQVDYIKEAFDKLYNCVMPFVDLTQFASADTAFKELDKKVHSEIYILKKCLSERDKAVEAGLTRSEVDRERISDLSADLLEANNRIETLRRDNEKLANACSEATKEVEQYKKSFLVEEIDRLREVMNGLRKQLHKLEEENASLREAPFNTLEALKKENSELKTRNERLNTTCESRLKALFEARIEAAQYKKSFMEHYEENDRLREVVDTLEKEINTLKKKIHELEEENIHKRPWHGDGNAMAGGRTCCESLVEAIEFQNKKIEELEAEKVRLKEAYDIQETTIKRLKLLLGKEREEKEVPTDHEFEFGDKVLVPWSDIPYMYIKRELMYNPRTESLVYVGKTQHLKWLGERFEIK